MKLRQIFRAFTLVELLMVMVIIGILAGLVLGTAGYVRRKGAASRAEAEIAALSAACESYKADNGIYPTSSGTTDTLGPAMSTAYSPASYVSASRFLYGELSGDRNFDREVDSGAKSYFEFAPSMLRPSGSGNVEYIADPYGYSYGYSTAAASEIATSGSSTKGYNPTFDLWSTAGTSSSTTSGTGAKWIKNW